MKIRSAGRSGSSAGRYERRIVVIGANDMGIHLAATLGGRGENIVLIDESEELLAGLNEEIDVLTLVGNPLAKETLQTAGVGNGVRLIAVTHSDELNILLLFLGESLGIPEGYALVRDRAVYESFLPRMLRSGGRLHLVYLWELIVWEMEKKNHLQFRPLYRPEGGHSFLAAVRFFPRHPLIGTAFHQWKPGAHSRILGSYRQGQFRPIEAGMKIEPGSAILLEMEKSEQESGTRRWMNFDGRHKIAVGGISCLQAFQEHWPGFFHDLVCIEKDLSACQRLLNMSTRILVLRGDGLDVALLKEEARIEDACFFLAASEQDEVNLLSGLIARSYQVPNVFTLLHRRQHSGMLERISPDGIITIPQLVADYLQCRLWSRKDDLCLTHLSVRINAEAPEKGLTLFWRNGMFQLLPENTAGAGERVTIVWV